MENQGMPELVGPQIQIQLILGETAERQPVIAVNGVIVNGPAAQPLSAEDSMIYMLKAVTKHLESLVALQEPPSQILLPVPNMRRI